MSEEQNKEKKCCCKCIAIVAVVALLMSIASLTMSIMNFNNAPKHKAVVISKQYDKGQSFEKAVAKEKPMLVFFYTDWCGYCQKFAPTFAKIAKSKEIKKNLAVAYVNCEQSSNQKTIQEYEIQGFPTVFVVKDGKKIQLDNHKFFADDAKEELTKDIQKAIE